MRPRYAGCDLVVRRAGEIKLLCEPEITCREIVDAHNSQRVIRIEVNDGIRACHLDIQIAEVIDFSSC